MPSTRARRALSRSEGGHASAGAAPTRRGRGRPPAPHEKRTWPVVFARVPHELREQLGVYLARTRPRRRLEEVVAEALADYLRRSEQSPR
jgi:hypothetical protein